jgi:hypothetical protein
MSWSVKFVAFGKWPSLPSPPRYLEIGAVKNCQNDYLWLIFGADSENRTPGVRRVRNRTEPDFEIFRILHRSQLSRTRAVCDVSTATVSLRVQTPQRTSRTVRTSRKVDSGGPARVRRSVSAETESSKSALKKTSGFSTAVLKSPFPDMSGLPEHDFRTLRPKFSQQVACSKTGGHVRS